MKELLWENRVLRLVIVLTMVLTLNVIFFPTMASAEEDGWECLDTPLSFGGLLSYEIEIPDTPIAKIMIQVSNCNLTAASSNYLYIYFDESNPYIYVGGGLLLFRPLSC